MKSLIAGIGNIFFSDDGFGCAVAGACALEALPDDTCVRDFGISGMHLAFEMLDGYDLVVLADAVKRAGAPGTLYLIEPGEVAPSTPDAHAMDVQHVLALFDRLAAQSGDAKRPAIAIVGCQPERLDEGIGLSATVAAAIPNAVALTCSVVKRGGAGVPTA